MASGQLQQSRKGLNALLKHIHLVYGFWFIYIYIYHLQFADQAAVCICDSVHREPISFIQVLISKCSGILPVPKNSSNDLYCEMWKDLEVKVKPLLQMLE